jgi:hypothetical protein
MSVEITLESDGRVRVKVDRSGERAVSDVVDAEELIHTIADTAGIDLADISGEEEPDEEPEELTGQPGIDESAPSEPEEGESAQEDDNV